MNTANGLPVEKFIYSDEYCGGIRKGHEMKACVPGGSSVQKIIDGSTICPLCDAAAWPVASAIRHFRDEFEYHIKHPDKAKATWFPSKSIYSGAKSAVAV